MAKRRGSADGGISKMEAVRRVLTEEPGAKASVIVQRVKEAHGIDLDPKMAATYRYHIMRTVAKKNRKAVRAVQGANGDASSDGVDDLLRAARKLGWQRLQEIVQGVLNAPT